MTEIDWTEIVLDLRRAGMAQQDIARATRGASGEAAIRSYLAGASPIHWRGEVLLTLWMKTTGKPKEHAPLRTASPYRGVQGKAGRRRVALAQLPRLAQACGVSVAQLMRMLENGKRSIKAKRKHGSANLNLPGFE